MAYIWEDYEGSIVYRQGNIISPYVEVLSDNPQVRYVNPLLRFANIFGALSCLKYDETESECTQNCVMENYNSTDMENVLFHYLAMVDRMKGVDRKQIEMDALEKEMKAGAFGNIVSENWSAIKKRDQVIILDAVVSKYCSNVLDHYFLIAIQKLFEQVSIIFEKETETYYLYISDNDTDYNEMLAKIVKCLLWDLQCMLVIVWHNHYGIIGNDDTMRIADIKII